MTQDIESLSPEAGTATKAPPTPQDILRAAADLCQTGWIQGYSAVSPREGFPMWRYCAVGAIYGAAEELCGTWDDPLRRIASKMLRAHLGPRAETGIENWNDAPERTQEEVVEAMRAAATMVWPQVEA